MFSPATPSEYPDALTEKHCTVGYSREGSNDPLFHAQPCPLDLHQLTTDLTWYVQISSSLSRDMFPATNKKVTRFTNLSRMTELMIDVL